MNSLNYIVYLVVFVVIIIVCCSLLSCWLARWTLSSAQKTMNGWREKEKKIEQKPKRRVDSSIIFHNARVIVEIVLHSFDLSFIPFVGVFFFLSSHSLRSRSMLTRVAILIIYMNKFTQSTRYHQTAPRTHAERRRIKQRKTSSSSNLTRHSTQKVPSIFFAFIRSQRELQLEKKAPNRNGTGKGKEREARISLCVIIRSVAMLLGDE